MQVPGAQPAWTLHAMPKLEKEGAFPPCCRYSRSIVVRSSAKIPKGRRADKKATTYVPITGQPVCACKTGRAVTEPVFTDERHNIGSTCAGKPVDTAIEPILSGTCAVAGATGQVKLTPPGSPPGTNGNGLDGLVSLGYDTGLGNGSDALRMLA